MPVFPAEATGIIYTVSQGFTDIFKVARRYADIEVALELSIQAKVILATVPAKKFSATLPGCTNSARLTSIISAAASRQSAMIAHMGDTSCAQTFTGPIRGQRSDMSKITQSSTSTGIYKQCAASSLRQTDTVLLRREKTELADNHQTTMRKSIFYGDSDSSHMLRGTDGQPELQRTMPQVWEDGDMGVIVMPDGRMASRANALVHEIGEIKVVKKANRDAEAAKEETKEWKVLPIAMASAPESKYM